MDFPSNKFRNGTQILSKRRPDALKKLSGEGLKSMLEICVIFVALGSQNGGQIEVKFVTNRGLGRALRLEEGLRGSGWPPGLNFDGFLIER